LFNRRNKVAVITRGQNELPGGALGPIPSWIEEARVGHRALAESALPFGFGNEKPADDYKSFDIEQNQRHQKRTVVADLAEKRRLETRTSITQSPQKPYFI
jgi:hypothetical protein